MQMSERIIKYFKTTGTNFMPSKSISNGSVISVLHCLTEVQELADFFMNKPTNKQKDELLTLSFQNLFK